MESATCREHFIPGISLIMANENFSTKNYPITRLYFTFHVNLMFYNYTRPVSP